MACKDSKSSQPRYPLKAGTAPPEFVGFEYKELSTSGKQACYEWRCEHGLCTFCGLQDHMSFRCDLREKLNKKQTRRENVANKGKARASGAEAGMVPENLVGIAYKDFDEGQKRECFDWRRKNGLCTSCGSGEHKHYECSLHKKNIVKHGIPEAHKHNGKPKLLTAETGAVPENLVGIAYKDFTEDQKKEYRDWRRANGLCLFCGSNGHQQSGCELRKVYLAKHGIEDKPKSEPKPKAEPVIAQLGKVPAGLVGLAYKDFTPEQKDACHTWRADRKLCTSCGEHGHKRLKCPTREESIQKRLEHKIRIFTRGKTVQRSGPCKFIDLPREVRNLVYVELLVKKKDIDYKARSPPKVFVLNKQIYAEALEIYLSQNSFRICDKGLRHFQKMLENNNAHDLVRGLHLSHFAWKHVTTAEITSSIQLIKSCPKLRKLWFFFNHCHLNYYHPYDEDWEPLEVSGVAARFRFAELLKVDTLKALTTHEGNYDVSPTLVKLEEWFLQGLKEVNEENKSKREVRYVTMCGPGGSGEDEGWYDV